jgi:hypothetical protein
VGNIRRVAAVGNSASLIGQPVTSAGANTTVASWTLNQKKMFTKVSDTRGSRVPSLITGTISLTGPTEIGTEGVVVINGVAAGVIGELSGVRDVVEYTAILDYSLLTDGAHTVELYVRSADGTLSKVGAPK